jgi:hypothetical protein
MHVRHTNTVTTKTVFVYGAARLAISCLALYGFAL